MFGPVRGTRQDHEWTGWWGDEPPYHQPVFVLAHHPRQPVEVEGGITFHCVTDGIESALRQAREAADGADVRIGGDAQVVRQYLRAGLLDEMHLVLLPILLGDGELLIGDIRPRRLLPVRRDRRLVRGHPRQAVEAMGCIRTVLEAQPAVLEQDGHERVVRSFARLTDRSGRPIEGAEISLGPGSSDRTENMR